MVKCHLDIPRDKRVACIKEIRTVLPNCGLKEAKDATDIGFLWIDTDKATALKDTLATVGTVVTFEGLTDPNSNVPLAQQATKDAQIRVALRLKARKDALKKLGEAIMELAETL